MNANSPSESSVGDEKELRAVLISHFHLSSETVDKIHAAMLPTDAFCGIRQPPVFRLYLHNCPITLNIVLRYL